MASAEQLCYNSVAKGIFQTGVGMKDYRIYYFTEKSNGREGNQDNFCVNGKINEDSGNHSEGTENMKAPFAVAVFDGMGGEAYGEVASLYAAKTFKEYEGRFKECEDADSLDESLSSYSKEVNKQIKEFLTDRGIDFLCCGTTCAGVLINEDKFIPFWLGDSRVYLWHAEKKSIELLSHDDTEAQRWIDMGWLKEEEARDTSAWHTLNAYLGDSYFYIRIGKEAKIEKGDVILISSDGITDLLIDAAIEQMLKYPVEKAYKILIETACNWSEDNSTVILVTKAE